MNHLFILSPAFCLFMVYSVLEATPNDSEKLNDNNFSFPVVNLTLDANNKTSNKLEKSPSNNLNNSKSDIEINGFDPISSSKSLEAKKSDRVTLLEELLADVRKLSMKYDDSSISAGIAEGRNLAIDSTAAILPEEGLVMKDSGSSERVLKDDNTTLHHIVLCWLKKRGSKDDCQKIIDVTKSFRGIPGVLNAQAGQVIMSDREIVDDSFDVGILIVTKNQEDLQKYLDHPIHQQAKKEVLLPLVERILVYDFMD